MLLSQNLNRCWRQRPHESVDGPPRTRQLSMELRLRHPWLAPSDEVREEQRAVLISTLMPSLPRSPRELQAGTMNPTRIRHTSPALQRSEKSQRRRQMVLHQQQILYKVESRQHLLYSLLLLAASATWQRVHWAPKLLDPKSERLWMRYEFVMGWVGVRLAFKARI